MKIIIYFLILLSIPPANALTWTEFWEPFIENAQNYSSGIYFIRMIVNNKESGIKKILLVK